MVDECLCPECRQPMDKRPYGIFYCRHCKRSYSVVPLIGGWRLVPISGSEVVPDAN